MNKEFRHLLQTWSIPVLRDVDIATLFLGEKPKQHAIVNRAMNNGSLVRLKRGVYCIGNPYRKALPSAFEVSRTLYGPSYVSFESALSYHGWIPEAVYLTTCATSKRSKEFDTPLGLFHYSHVPSYLFYLGVERVQDEFLIATPWKAIADHFYVHKRNWKRLKDLCLDLRIEREDLFESDLEMLKTLSENYQSKRVRIFLSKILGEF